MDVRASSVTDRRTGQDGREDSLVESETCSPAHGQEQRGELLLDLSTHLPGVLFQLRLDPDGQTRFTYLSPATRALYDLDEVEAVTDDGNLVARVHPEDAVRLGVSMQVSAHTLAPWRHEFRTRLSDGQLSWRALEAWPERQADGGVLWHGHTIDISERKQFESVLRQNEERWKLAIEGVGDGVWDWDVAANTIVYSSRWKAMLGYRDEEISNRPDEWTNRVHPDDVTLTEDNGRRLADGSTQQTAIEVRLRAKDGSWRWVLSRGCVIERDAQGQPLRIIGTNSDVTERKRMEEALRESEERWMFALDGAGEGVWDLNVQTGVIVLSARWKAILGYADHELESAPGTWSSLIHPDDLEAASQSRMSLQNGHITRADIEMRMRNKEGEWRWILSRGKTVSRDERGLPLRIVGTISDITERKCMEESLRENEERWKLALEGAGHGVWDWDLVTNEAMYSRRWKQIIGYAEDEIGTSVQEWSSRIHPDDQAVVIASYQAVTSGQKARDSIEIRMRCKDGSWKWVMGTGILIHRDYRGRTSRMVGTLSDISERKRVEDALRTSEERWKFALEGAGDGVWDWDVTTNCISFSPRAGEILGLTLDELSQDYNDWCARIHPEDVASVMANREPLLTSKRNTSSSELRVRLPDGQWIWLLSRGMVVSRDNEGQALRMVGLLSDITRRKEMEEALRVSLGELDARRRDAEQHAEAKSHFLNAASHDLRQPLYATQLFADALATSGLNAEQQTMLDNLQLSVKSMSAQLEGLLELSRFDMGKIEPHWQALAIEDVFASLAATYAPIAEKAGVRLLFMPQSGCVHGDAMLLGRLLGNLIDNAIKFTQASQGLVAVCARRVDQGWRLEVRDNGSGIAEHHVQKIFDEYFQVDNPSRHPSAGFGLGLSIVQRIARLLDAPLSLRSQLGRGTVFGVTLARMPSDHARAS